MPVVVFDYASWAVRYPELGGSINSSIAQLFFNEATLYCDNTDCSPVIDIGQRTVFLNMLTAHIAALNGFINGQAPSTIVGRISSASEGSVSVQTQNDYPPGCVQWYQQTRYGSAYWAASAPYRLAAYIPGPSFDSDPYGRLGPY